MNAGTQRHWDRWEQIQMFIIDDAWEFRVRFVRVLARMHRDPAWNNPPR
jgi:hypothetical protein